MKTLQPERTLFGKFESEQKALRETTNRFVGQTALRGMEYQFGLDLATDLSERFAAPMESSFSYEVRYGDLFDKDGTSLMKIVQDGLDSSRNDMALHPELQFDYDRAVEDMRELESAVNLEDGAMMVRFSPIPDAILAGVSSQSGGYNRERRKMLARVIERSGDNVTITHFSLDQSDPSAIRTTMAALGVELPATYNSEQVVKTHIHLSRDDPRFLTVEPFAKSRQNPETFRRPSDAPQKSQLLIDAVRNLYDAQLRLDSGKEYFAGRPINDIKNSLDYVLSFPDELEQLGAAIQANPMRREMLLYNHIAWLESKVGSRHSDQIEHTGDYMSDSAEAGDSDRAAGVNHDGDCPTGLSNSTAADNATQLGYNISKTQAQNIGKKWMRCPMKYCGEMTYSDPCDPVCQCCGSQPGHDRSYQYFLQKKAKSESEKGPDNKMKNRYPKFGKKVLDNIKYFRYGDGIFSGVVAAIDYFGRAVGDGEAAAEMYREKYNLVA